MAAYLINPARQTYRLDEVCMEALGDCPPALDPALAGEALGRALAERARWVHRYWAYATGEMDARGVRRIYGGLSNEQQKARHGFQPVARWYCARAHPGFLNRALGLTLDRTHPSPAPIPAK